MPGTSILHFQQGKSACLYAKNNDVLTYVLAKYTAKQVVKSVPPQCISVSSQLKRYKIKGSKWIGKEGTQ